MCGFVWPAVIRVLMQNNSTANETKADQRPGQNQIIFNASNTMPPQFKFLLPRLSARI